MTRPTEGGSYRKRKNGERPELIARTNEAAPVKEPPSQAATAPAESAKPATTAKPKES